MKVDEMERLLAAYYEGTTDEHEENRLKEALRTEDVPEHLESDRRLLAALEEESPQEIPVPEGLEEKLSRLIDRKDEELPHFLRPNRTRRNWRWAAGVAATFLVLMGIGWGVTTMEKKPVPPTPLARRSTPSATRRTLIACYRLRSARCRATGGPASSRCRKCSRRWTWCSRK